MAKKSFLTSVAVAVTALLSGGTDKNANAANLEGLTSSSIDNSINRNILLMKPVIDKKLMHLSGHSSHASHGSHGSHGSHSSHVSGTGGGGAVAPKRSPAVPNVVPTPSPKKTIPNNGPSNLTLTTIEQVQLILFAMGYYNGSINGILDSNLRSSISNYQRDKGLKVTGRIDNSLINSLNSNW